jgi:hypothetical protein
VAAAIGRGRCAAHDQVDHLQRRAQGQQLGGVDVAGVMR